MSIPRYDIRPVMRSLASLCRASFATAGSGAAVTPTLAGGAVTSLTVASGGSGYGEYQRITFDGGDISAEAFLKVTGGAVAGASLIAGGSGYTTTPTATIAPAVNYVFDAIPLLFSETAPFMYFTYQGGSNAYETYCLTRREYNIHVIAAQCLLQETRQADLMTREFPGMFMDFMLRNYSIGGVVREAIVVSDSVVTVNLRSSPNGGVQYLANMFDVLVIDGD